MAERSRSRRLFEELNLISETEQRNPFGVLGLDREYVADLLKDDPNGEIVKFTADALYRAAARRLHPDMSGTANVEKFRQIDEARDRITKASRALLLQWSKEEKVVSSHQVERVRSAHNLLLERSTDMLQKNLEFGNHPKHFSRLEWSQGVLLQRNKTPLLMRRQLNGDNLHILKGQVSMPRPEAVHVNKQLAHFQNFLQSYELFGLPPDSKVVAYIDEEGRASLLEPDLTFIMDITDPIQRERDPKNSSSRTLLTDDDLGADAWLRMPHPTMLVADVAHPGVANGQLIQFPSQVSHNRTRQSYEWHLPLEVAGTLANTNLFARMKHTAKNTPSLMSSARKQTVSYFNLAATPTHSLLEQEAGYTPLLLEGNSLLLYDSVDHLPIMSDAEVIGMIGSNSQSS